MTYWTQGEIELLEEMFCSASRADICSKLPGRTWKAIERKAEALELKRRRHHRPQFGLPIPSWLVGELLGDGHITPGGRFRHTAKHHEYSVLIQDKCQCDGIRAMLHRDSRRDKRTGNTCERTLLRTYCIFKAARQHWYPEGIKDIPTDLVVDHEVFLHWFIGDGSVSRDRFILATEGFPDTKPIRRVLGDYGVTVSVQATGQVYIQKNSLSRATMKSFLAEKWTDFPDCYLYKRDGLLEWANFKRTWG